MWKGSVGVCYMARFLARDLSLLGRMEELFKQMQVHEGELEDYETELQYFLEGGHNCMKLLTRKLRMWVKIHGTFVTIERLCEVLLEVDLIVTTERLLAKFSPKVGIALEESLSKTLRSGIPTSIELSSEDIGMLKERLNKPTAVKLAVALVKHQMSECVEHGDAYDVNQFMRDFENKLHLKSRVKSVTRIVWEVVLEKMSTKKSLRIEGDFARCLLDILPFFTPTGVYIEDLWDLIEPINVETCEETYCQALRLLLSLRIVVLRNNKIRLLKLPNALIQPEFRKRIQRIISNLVSGLCSVLKNQFKVKQSLLLEILFIWNKLKTEHKMYLQQNQNSLQIPVLISHSMFQHGMYRNLMEYTEETVKLFAKLKVPDSNEDFLELRRWQGYILDILGYSEIAADILQSVYLKMKSQFGMNYKGTLNVANDYIKALCNGRQFDRARGLIIEILFVTPMVDFSDEVVVALCRTQTFFGRILALSALEPAICFLKESHLKLRKMCGTGNLWTIESAELLGLSYAAYRDYRRALKIFKYTLKLKRNSKVLGEFHPETTMSKFYLGMIHILLKNYSKALDYLTEAHTLLLKTFGKSYEYFIVTHQVILVCLKTYQDNPNDEKFFNERSKPLVKVTSPSSHK